MRTEPADAAASTGVAIDAPAVRFDAPAVRFRLGCLRRIPDRAAIEERSTFVGSDRSSRCSAR